MKITNCKDSFYNRPIRKKYYLVEAGKLSHSEFSNII